VQPLRPHSDSDHRLLEALAGVALLLQSSLCVAQAQAPAREIAEQLRDEALRDSRAWDMLDSLVSEIGARPTGSPAMTRAKDRCSRR
jgi:hypothetical protein